MAVARKFTRLSCEHWGCNAQPSTFTIWTSRQYPQRSLYT